MLPVPSPDPQGETLTAPGLDIPDWNADLDDIFRVAGGDRELNSNITRTVDSTTGRTTIVHATVPDPRYSWHRQHWIILDISAGPNPGDIRVQSWAVRITDDEALTDLAMLTVRFESPGHDTILTPTRRPQKRAKPGPMTREHAAHRVWQLAVQRGASVTLGEYPLTRAIPGLHLNMATRHSRIKANGLIDGRAFRFEITKNAEAYLRYPSPDGTDEEVIGPVTLEQVGLSGTETTDKQLATLLAALLT